MIGRLIGGLGLALALNAHALAQTCASYPNVLTDGTTADANQVMANFNCAALLGGAHFTGYVGIGVAAPQVPLEVSGNIFADAVTSGGSNGSYLTNAGSVVAGYSVNNTANQTYLDFKTNLYLRNTQQSYYTNLSILNNGNVGIATPNPAAPLEVYGASGTPTYSTSNSFNPSGSIFAVNASGGNGLSVGVYGSSGTYGTWMQSGFQGSIVAPYALILNPFGGNVGIATTSPSQTLYVNGSAGGTTAWSISSDLRLKQNIETIRDALSVIEGLRGVRFQWRPPHERSIGQDLKLPLNETQFGFIAQEVEKVAPEAVVVPKAGSDVPYSLKDSFIVPILVEAIKAQQAEINDMKSELGALQSRIAQIQPRP